jgi:hypothetical protein
MVIEFPGARRSAQKSAFLEDNVHPLQLFPVENGPHKDSASPFRPLFSFFPSLELLYLALIAALFLYLSAPLLSPCVLVDTAGPLPYPTACPWVYTDAT